MNQKTLHLLLTAVLSTCTSLLAAPGQNDFTPQPQVPYLSPQESLAKIQLPPGYRLELVLSEPEIKEPVICVFDGNNRMFVAEMRTYMQDIDGKNQHDRVSRVSMHVDTNGDGIFDRHTVFIDKLLLPRMILPLDDRLVVGETDSNDLYAYRDTNGDGVADTKEPFYIGGRRGGNLEHQPSGLIWSLDNWLYTTYNSYRLRYTPGGVLKEPSGPNGGQWGLTQDNYGKPWFVNAGGERGPINFQVPIAYGAFSAKNEFTRGYAEVWPLVQIPDVQGGLGRSRWPERTLNHFTATCGGEIYRGDRLPEDLRGDLLFAEPVGRLIRRTKIDVREGLTYLSNPYEKSEFIRSTDPNFRPLNMVTAPDGCLYIVDMYRGIIQEGNWVRPGAYLRKVVQQYGLENNAGRGRIYRLVHDDFKRGPAPRLLDESSAQLVARLQHPNGWWRDTAQKLLILRGDKSIAPALQAVARGSGNELARIHAIWTLEGLDLLTPALVRERLKDESPQVRLASIRASETLIKKGDTNLVADLLAMAADADPNVVIQTMLTANLLQGKASEPFIQATITRHRAAGVKEIGDKLLSPPQSDSGKPRFNREELAFLKKGEATYKELCFACHGPDGKGTPMEGAPAGTTLAPSFAGSPSVLGHRDMPINILLHGLTGPVRGKTYESLMVPMHSYDDEWIASVLSYVRTSFGNNASLISTNEVAIARAANKTREVPWTMEELQSVVPQVLARSGKWKLSASHNEKSLRAAIDGKPGTRWDTGASQTPGMWFQIELPKPERIAGVQLDSTGSARDYPRGYKVELSTDGKSWGKPVASGKGSHPLTEVVFSPEPAKFIRITQTGAVDGLFWSIHDLHLLAKNDSAPPIKTATPVKNIYE